MHSFRDLIALISNSYFKSKLKNACAYDFWGANRINSNKAFFGKYWRQYKLLVRILVIIVSWGFNPLSIHSSKWKIKNGKWKIDMGFFKEKSVKYLSTIHPFNLSTLFTSWALSFDSLLTAHDSRDCEVRYA